MSLADYEDFYYGACLGDDDDPRHRLGARLRGDQAARRVDRGPRGGARDRRPAPTSARASPAARSSPADGKHNMPDGEFFTGPVEDSVEGEVSFHLPATLSRGREVAGVRFRFEGGKVVDATRRAGRGVPDRDARHRRGRPPPRRARHRHQLRDRPRHRRDPARREDRRHRPHGRRPQLSRDRRRQRVRRSTGTWSATCARAARSRSTASRCSATASSWSRAATLVPKPGSTRQKR